MRASRLISCVRSANRVPALRLAGSKKFYCTKAEPVEAEFVEKASTTTTEEPVFSEEPIETKGPMKDKLEKTEKVVGEASKHEFQAETRKLLDIVAKSLYTDKEVSFIIF